MTVKTKHMTYEDYLVSPGIKKRYEIIDGEMMIQEPGPTYGHHKILRELFLLLDAFVSERNLGEVLFAPLDLLIRKRPLRTRQPDLMYISRERSYIIDNQIQGGPDIVIEVLSPANTHNHIMNKLSDYAHLGVSECWVVAPEGATVEVLVLDKTQYKRAGLFGAGDQVRSHVLAELALDVNQIFK